MIAPVSRLRKDEIIWLSKHRCRHHHTYLEHYGCFLSENPDTQRIGFFDIETTGFKADWDWMLTYCILDDKTDKIYTDLIKVKDLQNENVTDKIVVKQCVEDLKNFDILVGFYNERFDNRFVRTRAVIHNISFPHYDEMKSKDIYFTVRNKFSLGSNRLENACRVLLGKSTKTHMDKRIWQIAQRCGNKKALGYIQDHCVKDVQDLKKLYHKVYPFSKNLMRSI